MKYRKRPVVVEASQWFGGSRPAGLRHDQETGEFFTVTIHGQKTPVAVGDWIIVESEQRPFAGILAYPCKQEIFAATYEPCGVI